MLGDQDLYCIAEPSETGLMKANKPEISLSVGGTYIL